MGALYKVSCKQCNYQYEQVVGPLMSGPTFACQTCGLQPDRPCLAPANEKEMELGQLAVFFLRRKWPIEGRKFTRSESEDLISLVQAKGCKCGGSIIEECAENQIRYCCVRCGSDDIAREWIGNAD